MPPPTAHVTILIQFCKFRFFFAKKFLFVYRKNEIDEILLRIVSLFLLFMKSIHVYCQLCALYSTPISGCNNWITRKLCKKERERVNGRKKNVEWRQIEWEKSVCVNIGKISKDEN